MRALYLKELRSFLSSIIGYIFVFIFLTLNWLMLWEISSDSNILQWEDANLIPFFKLSPLIFLILIPAITMKSFSEERRTGTIELLFTKPISDYKILLAKFFAGVTLVVISLLPTLVYYLTVHLIGDPVGVIDDGATIGSYLGLLLLGSAFVAIGIFTSSFTKSQIVAFILAAFLSWVMFDGLGMIASFEKLGSFDFVIDYIGMSSHYESIQRGVIDTKDVIYFATVIIVFLLGTGITINRNKGKRLISFALVAVILVLANVVSVYNFKRIDLTEDQRFSLSASTIEYLESDENFSEPVFFKIYLDGDLPAPLLKTKNAIKEKLDQFRVYAGNKIQYEFRNPDDVDPIKRKEILNQTYGEGKGIQPLNYELIEETEASVKTFWPGAIATYKGNKNEVIQFLQRKQVRADERLTDLVNAVENNLEFQLINEIHKLVREGKKKIAFLQGHGELDDRETYVARKVLSENYVVEEVTIDQQINALNNYDGLIIAQPKTAFNERDKFVIDQFIMRGGKTMWLINPIDVNEDSLHRRGETYALTRQLNLQDLLFAYGARVDNEIILQKDCSFKYIPFDGKKIWPWPFFINIQGGGHLVSKNIDPVKCDYASPISFVGYDSIKKTTVLQSKMMSQYWKPPVRINLNLALPTLNPFTEWEGKPQQKTVAGILEGRFTSLYKDRLTQEFIQSPDFTTMETSVPNKVFVMGDANFIKNGFRESMDPKTGKILVSPTDNLMFDGAEKHFLKNPPAYGNLSLFINTVDYMLGDQSVIGSRNKGITKRKLDMEKVKESPRFWKMINLIVPLLSITILLVIMIVTRRMKYARRK